MGHKYCSNLQNRRQMSALHSNIQQKYLITFFGPCNHPPLLLLLIVVVVSHTKARIDDIFISWVKVGPSCVSVPLVMKGTLYVLIRREAEANRHL